MTDRDLDRWIAENVMKVGSWKDANWPLCEYYGNVSKPYSSDIAAAWEVVEKMGQYGYRIQIITNGKDTHCFFWKGNTSSDYENAPLSSYDESVPMAICLAAEQAFDKDTK